MNLAPKVQIFLQDKLRAAGLDFDLSDEELRAMARVLIGCWLKNALLDPDGATVKDADIACKILLSLKADKALQVEARKVFRGIDTMRLMLRLDEIRGVTTRAALQ